MKLPTCIICERALCSDVVNIFEKGQKKLVWASTLRNDGKFQKVLDNPIQLHFKCRRKYTNEDCVLCVAKKLARENAQVTIPTDRAHEVENVKEDCNSTTIKCNSANNESSIEATAIKRDPDCEKTNNNNIRHTESEEKNRDSADVDINQSLSGCVSPQLVLEVPQSLPLTNNQNYIEIEVEKSIADGQNIEIITEEEKEKEKGSSSKYLNRNDFKLTSDSNSMNGNNALFDYKNQCFFCAGDASEDFIKAQKNNTSKNKVLVYRVSRPHIVDNILCHCLHFESNDVSKVVRSRIENKDLKALRARYHKVCYTKFLCMATNIHSKRGRPMSKEIHDQMQLVIDYIDNYTDDGTEISLNDIKRILNLDINDRTMKHKLVCHYGETIDVDLPNNRVMKRKVVDNNDDSVVPEDSSSAAVDDITEQHSGYRCDVCFEDIFKYRYACVQCANVDLCGACEARGEHATHYVFRIPANKPHVEVQAVLDNIRNFLSTKNNYDNSLPAKPERNEDNEDKTELYAEEKTEQYPQEDPLAAPSEDCQHDVSELPEKQTYAAEAPLLIQSDAMEQTEDEESVTVSILTEPIGMHSDVTLYTQLKTEKVDEENLSSSQVKVEPLTEENQMAVYSGMYNGPSRREHKAKEELYSRQMIKHVEEIQKPLRSNMTEQLSKTNTPVYTGMKSESSTEGIQMPRWLGRGPSSEENQDSYSAVGSGCGVPNERLRKRSGTGAAQSTFKRKSKLEFLLTQPKLRK